MSILIVRFCLVFQLVQITIIDFNLKPLIIYLYFFKSKPLAYILYTFTIYNFKFHCIEGFFCTSLSI
nr:MAG TPA: hypothetical protein [Caudoviricetes sp.]